MKWKIESIDPSLDLLGLRWAEYTTCNYTLHVISTLNNAKVVLINSFYRLYSKKSKVVKKVTKSFSIGEIDRP